jgi:CRP-like cAMP-binding protein
MKEMLTNRILTGLSDDEFARLVPLLEPVTLHAGERLSEAGETARSVYFPENSVVSCHADMRDGKTAEVGMVGRDGVAGLSSLLGQGPAAHSVSVSVAGSALRVGREEFGRELERADGLRQSLLTYSAEYLTQVAQRAACAVLHKLEQRLAVWLLLLADRLDSDTIEITQERIAHHLGVRRAGVTVVAAHMQAAGAISYTRGSVRVADRRALEATACECYGALAAGRRQTAYM